MRSDAKFHGLLLVDKPKGITSHDLVAKVRRIFEQREVGHTGTLDPLAEGLMVVCLGRATKLAQFVLADSKTYVATLVLGQESETLDAEKASIDAAKDVSHLTDADIAEVVASFEGQITQTVPAYSAIKKDGKPLYSYARSGVQVELPSRAVEIAAISIREVALPRVTIEISCSKGTYIRALADDIGKKLGVGAYLGELRRTRIGSFHIAEAHTLEDFDKAKELGKLGQFVVPIESSLSFGAFVLSDHSAERVTHGQTPTWDDIAGIEGRFNQGEPVMMKNSLGRALAIGLSGCNSGEAIRHKGQPVSSFIRVLA